MFTNTRPALTFLSMMFAAIVASTGTLKADHYDHIDRLAVRIQKNSQRLVNELKHYRHTPEYQHLVNDTLQLRNSAQHIHDVTHFEGNLNHLGSDLAQLDQSFHHLESVFDRIEIEAAHGHGHVHGNTKHVKNMLNRIENDIHHIQDDVRELRQTPHIVASRPVVSSYRVPYSNYSQHSSHHYGGHNRHNGHGGHHNNHSNQRGFSIGGGSSKLWIRF